VFAQPFSLRMSADREADKMHGLCFRAGSGVGDILFACGDGRGGACRHSEQAENCSCTVLYTTRNVVQHSLRATAKQRVCHSSYTIRWNRFLNPASLVAGYTPFSETNFTLFPSSCAANSCSFSVRSDQRVFAVTPDPVNHSCKR
jgi:hypothetical protein